MAIIGIDFGTSTMVVATLRGGEAALLRDGRGDDVIPSVVAFMPTGRVTVGRSAKARRLIDAHNTLFSIKRILGKQWLSVEVAEFRKLYPFAMERAEDRFPRFITRVGKLSAVEVGAHLLEHIKSILPPGAHDIRMTVPASFDSQQRAATVDVAERAGFAGAKLLVEPHAAAVAYRQQIGDRKTIVVYDLGGGTFDLAVLKLGSGRAQVLAAGGDAYLGGDDVDQELAKWAAESILCAHRWDVRSNPGSYQALVFACERAKVRLSEIPETVVPLGQVDQVLEGKDLRIHREQVDATCRHLVQRSFVVCDDVLSQAGVHARDVDAVVLAGGGSYMPTVRDTVTHYFGMEPLVNLPPDHVVAMGAALFVA